MFNFFKNKQNQEDRDAFGENNLQESLTNRGLIGAATDRTEWSFSEKLKEKDILENKPAIKPGKSESCGALEQDSKRLLSTIETLEKQNKQYQHDLNTQRFEYDKVMSKLKKYKEDKRKLTTTIKSLEQQNLALLKRIKELEKPLKPENNQEEVKELPLPVEKPPHQEEMKESTIEKPSHEEIPQEEVIQDLDPVVPSVVEEKSAEEIADIKRHLKKLQADLKSIWGYLFEIPSKDILHIETIPQRADEINEKTIQKFLTYLFHECSKSILISNVDALVINLWECSTLTNQGIETFASLISNKFKKLKHLELRFSGLANLGNQGLQAIGDICRKLPGLNRLTLGFSNCPTISNSGVQILLSSIGKYSTHLQNLELTFDNCLLLSDESIQNMSRFLEKIAKNLQSLTLGFTNCPEVTGLYFSSLGSYISKYLRKNLKHLELSFNGCIQLSDGVLQSLTTSLSKNHFKSLSFLSLKFDNTQVSDKDLSDLAVCIGKTFLSLHHLELSFKNCDHFSDEGANYIGVYLSNHLKDLSSLILKFNSTRVYAKGVNGIGAYLGINLKNLERLELNLSNTKISDAGLSALGASFAQNFQKVHHLKLNLRSCSNISDKGLNEFTTLICSNLQNLTNLMLDLTDCPKISNNEFDNLKRSIKKYLPNFQNLKYDCWKNRRIQWKV